MAPKVGEAAIFFQLIEQEPGIYLTALPLLALLTFFFLRSVIPPSSFVERQ
jgi:hypothetical protein